MSVSMDTNKNYLLIIIIIVSTNFLVNMIFIVPSFNRYTFKKKKVPFKDLQYRGGIP